MKSNAVTDDRVAGFYNFDNGLVKASKVELSPTPTEQIVGVSEEIKQDKVDLPIENLYGKESSIGYKADLTKREGKARIQEIAGGIKVHLQPGQVLEKGDSESTEDKIKDTLQKGQETAEKLETLVKDIDKMTLRTDERTQLGTENKDKDSKKTAKGRGKSSGIEFKFIDDAVISGEIFKFKDANLSIRYLVDYIAFLSPDGTSISKDKASVFMTMLKENGRPLNKDSWNNWTIEQQNSPKK